MWTATLFLAAIAPMAPPSLALQSADGDWPLHLLTDAAASQGAVCLDGSPQAYYLRQPLTVPSGGPRTFVVFMEGGGWVS
jgi:hypothetical protein